MPQLLRGGLSPGVPMPPLNLAFVNKVRVAFCPFFNVAACRHDMQSFPLAGACCGRSTPRAHMACAPHLGSAPRLRVLPHCTAQRRWRTHAPRLESGNMEAAERETTLSTRTDLEGSVFTLSRFCTRADHGQAWAMNREFVHRLETKKAQESNPKCEINIEVLDYKPNLIIVSADES